MMGALYLVHNTAIPDSGSAVLYDQPYSATHGGGCIPTLTLQVQCLAHPPPHPRELKGRTLSRRGKLIAFVHRTLGLSC